MKLLLYSFMWLLALSTPVEENLREAYFIAAANKDQLPGFLKSVEKLVQKDHIYYCYRSAYYSLEANFSNSIVKKLKYFNLCKENIAKSFSIKDSFDAHFIRFCVQSESPSFLGYTTNMAGDKKYIFEHLKTLVAGNYKLKVKAYLAKCKALTETEKERVKGL
jgi:hypothetical protein